jgi:DNA-directed RNA polymerase subunit omega
MTVPQNVDSKFRFILVAAKRARQLQAGAKPLVQTQSKKVTKIARMEVEAGLVPFEILQISPTNGEKPNRSKSGK